MIQSRNSCYSSRITGVLRSSDAPGRKFGRVFGRTLKDLKIHDDNRTKLSANNSLVASKLREKLDRLCYTNLGEVTGNEVEGATEICLRL